MWKTFPGYYLSFIVAFERKNAIFKAAIQKVMLTCSTDKSQILKQKKKSKMWIISECN